MRLTFLTLPIAIALGADYSCAQTKVVPAIATVLDGNSNCYAPFTYDRFLYQQLWLSSEIAQTNATITGMAWRRDSQDNSPLLAAPTPPSFLLHFGHTSVTPTSMSTTFLSNTPSGTTTVFNGGLNLPAQPPAIGLGSFNITVPLSTPFAYQVSNGNLIVEMEVPGQASTKSWYPIDAQYTGAQGMIMNFGTPGSFGGSTQTARVTLGRNTPASTIVPGAPMDVRVYGMPQAFQTYIVYGFNTTFFTGGLLPFDLGILGAPGNTLYIAVDATSPPLTPTPYSSYFEAIFSLGIPNIPGLAGHNVYNQAIVLDSSANALGLVLSNGMGTLIGGMTAAPTTQFMGNTDSNQPTGSFFFRNGAGGPVVEFTGTFN